MPDTCRQQLIGAGIEPRLPTVPPSRLCGAPSIATESSTASATRARRELSVAGGPRGPVTTARSELFPVRTAGPALGLRPAARAQQPLFKLCQLVAPLCERAEDLLEHRKLLVKRGQLGFQRFDAAPLLSAIDLSCAAEKVPGSGSTPPADWRCSPNLARPSSLSVIPRSSAMNPWTKPGTMPDVLCSLSAIGLVLSGKPAAVPAAMHATAVSRQWSQVGLVARDAGDLCDVPPHLAKFIGEVPSAFAEGRVVGRDEAPVPGQL